MIVHVFALLGTALTAVFQWFNTLLNSIGFTPSMLCGLLAVVLFISRFVSLAIGSEIAGSVHSDKAHSKSSSKSSKAKEGS